MILKTQDKHAGQAGAGLNANRPTITNKMSRLNWHPSAPGSPTTPGSPTASGGTVTTGSPTTASPGSGG